MPCQVSIGAGTGNADRLMVALLTTGANGHWSDSERKPDLRLDSWNALRIAQ